MANEVIGGQAVIEGVMMINKEKKAVAVRNPDGKIVVRKEKLKLPSSKFVKLPFIRGVVSLCFMMWVGIRALNYSASIAEGEKEEKIGKWEFFFIMSFSLVFALALFKFLPLLVAKYIVGKFVILQVNNLVPNIIDGVLKIGIFAAYLWVLSLSEETRKIFEYHGAEHKVVRCREAGEALTVDNVRKFSRYHPRCGTAFVFGVFLISIFVFSIIPFTETGLWLNFGLRVMLLPVVMGISYEVLRLSGKKEANFFFKTITAPGMWFQRMTTREPTDEQLEVSIRAMKAVA